MRLDQYAIRLIPTEKVVPYLPTITQPNGIHSHVCNCSLRFSLGRQHFNGCLDRPPIGEFNTTMTC